MKRGFILVLIISLLTGCSYIAKKQPAPSPEVQPTATVTPTVQPSATPIVSPVPKKVEAANKTPQTGTTDLSNNKMGWGYTINKGSAPGVSEKVKTMLKENNAIYIGDNSKTVYLTFDEGYENGYTSAILDTLRENNVKAAFFITGAYLDKEQALVSRMVNEGHIVGNHTVNHLSMPTILDDEKLKLEITRVNDKYSTLFGQNMKYFRNPNGEYSQRTLKITSALGYKSVFWSFAYRDWETANQKGADYAYDTVMGQMHNGCILLLHAVSVDNKNALDKIIKDMKAKGYSFGTLNEI